MTNLVGNKKTQTKKNKHEWTEIQQTNINEQNIYITFRHVAFPGGHREKSETDLDAALRETREEVGLDMKHGNSENNLFHCCGRMTETQPFRQSKVVVSPFVFIQLQSKTPKLKLDSQEVASIRWTSLFHFEELENVLSHHQMACKNWNGKDMKMEKTTNTTQTYT